MDTKISGSQEPGSGLKYQKSTCCVPLEWQGATLKMAHFTRRQQPCQPCTQHVPSMSICTIKQEAKGTIKMGKAYRSKAQVISNSYNFSCKKSNKHELLSSADRTHSSIWPGFHNYSVSFLHSTIHEHHPGMLSSTPTRHIQGEKDSDQGQVSPRLLTPSHHWWELQVELSEGDGTPLPYRPQP